MSELADVGRDSPGCGGRAPSTRTGTSGSTVTEWHTVDLPDPAAAMDPGVRELIDRSTRRSKEQLGLALEKLQSGYCDGLEDGRDPAPGRQGRIRRPAVSGQGRLRGHRVAGELLEYLSGLDDRWRLIAILIASGSLDSVLDEI